MQRPRYRAAPASKRADMLTWTIGFGIVLCAAAPDAIAARIAKDAIGGTGGVAIGGARRLGFTGGLPVIGWSSSASRVEVAGFWGRSLGATSDAAEETPFPLVTSLDQNQPNPFRDNTELAFALAGTIDPSDPVRVEIFDSTGRRVRTLLSCQALPAGFHRVSWDARDDRGHSLASGIYFARLETNRTQITRKLTLAR